jgi:hypothetical protein
MPRCASSQTANPPVIMKCHATRCTLAANQNADHVVSIWNKRQGSLYEFEVCASAHIGKFNLGGASILLIFGPGPNGVGQIVPYTGLFSRCTRNSATITVADPMNPGTDEIHSVIDFYDSSQRAGQTFNGKKESYVIKYSIDYK